MSKFGSLYIDGTSIFHRSNPIVKLTIFILWSIVVFMFLDIKVSIIMLLLGIVILLVARLPVKMIRNFFIAVIIFNIINSVMILIIDPHYGVRLSGDKEILCTLLGLHFYYQTIMYVIVISLKYLSLLPVALILIFTTQPSELACSLNSIGIPYKLAYTFNIIFRYFPDIQNEFKTVANAQAARGISFGRDEKSILKRIKNLFSIMTPLINSALFRIDSITMAMELRSFGKKRKRTWYNQTKFTALDISILVISIIIFVLFMIYRDIIGYKFSYKIF